MGTWEEEPLQRLHTTIWRISSVGEGGRAQRARDFVMMMTMVATAKRE